jgi:hypothetical protein
LVGSGDFTHPTLRAPLRSRSVCLRRGGDFLAGVDLKLVVKLDRKMQGLVNAIVSTDIEQNNRF